LPGLPGLPGLPAFPGLRGTRAPRPKLFVNLHTSPGEGPPPVLRHHTDRAKLPFMDRRRFWTNTVFLWACAAIAAYLVAGAIDWSFIGWLFLFGVLSLPVVLVSARKRRW